MQRKYRFLWLALIIPLGAVGAFATGLVPIPWQAPEKTSDTAVGGRVVAPAEAEKKAVKQAAVQTPAKQPPSTTSKKPADKAAQPKLPFGIDVARLNGDGSSVIAGYGKPGKAMTLMADGKPVGVVTPDQQGDWVLVTAYKFAHLDPKLSLKFGNHVRKTVAALNTAPATSEPKVRRDTAPAKPAVAAQPQPTAPPPPKRRAAEVTEQMLERLKKLTKEAEARSEPDVAKPPAKSTQQVASAQPTPTTRPESTSKALARVPAKAAAATAPKVAQEVAALTKQSAAAAPTSSPRETPNVTESEQQTGKTEPEQTATPNAAAETPVTSQSKAKAPSEDQKAPAASPQTAQQPRPVAPIAPIAPVTQAAPRETAEAPQVKTEETAQARPATASERVKVAKAPAPVPSVAVQAPADSSRATEQAAVVAPQARTEAPAKTPGEAAKVAAAAPPASAKLPAVSEPRRASAAPSAAPPSGAAAVKPDKAAVAEKSSENQTVASASPTPATAPPSDVANLPVPVQFVYRKAELTPKGREAAALLLKYFLAKDFKYVVLSGHADERGTNRANMILSKQRLLRIKQLLREGGFQGQLKLVPKGETEKYTGVDRSQFDIEELWQLDRRVEVVSATAG